MFLLDLVLISCHTSSGGAPICSPIVMSLNPTCLLRRMRSTISGSLKDALFYLYVRGCGVDLMKDAEGGGVGGEGLERGRGGKTGGRKKLKRRKIIKRTVLPLTLTFSADS